MESRSVMLEFDFNGIPFRSSNYDYSKGFPGTYWEPPEPDELIINELEFQTDDGKWHEVIEPLFEIALPRSDLLQLLLLFFCEQTFS